MKKIHTTVSEEQVTALAAEAKSMGSLVSFVIAVCRFWKLK